MWSQRVLERMWYNVSENVLELVDEFSMHTAMRSRMFLLSRFC
ncbi:hypothetical protein B4U80_01373 [Leptotrombidium deliense]|uniref:Uncharacterized protein n=1 Tax=Leptotrombidium deliense TaxID=299467 RepID=A0A443S229_9ACAR|nr:hypothetical protein B4U80_01373 [Leptotrombidium deliense]